MAFSLSVSYYAGVQNQSLTDRNPYFMEGASGVSSAPVTRYGQRSPTQNGITDLGFYIQPRILTMKVGFNATTDSQLDTYRSTLLDIFRPSWPLVLVLTRDDGTTRSLACVVTDEVAIELDPYARVGHLHWATIRVRADDPRWYNSTAGTASYSGGSAQTWWTAGGLIGTANVMEHVEYPAQGQTWTYAGTITSSWSVIFRTVLDNTNGHAAFHAGTGALTGAATKDARLYYDGPNFQWSFDAGFYANNSPPGGTPNWQITHDSPSSDLHTMYYQGTAYQVQQFADFDISGTARRWRSDRLGSASSYWTNEIPKAAIYNKVLSQAERIALEGWMGNTATLGTITAVNAGDTNEYPIITIQGPIINPVLINATAGGTIDLTGVTLGSSDIYTIDLRYGDKRITDNFGSSQINNMGTPLQLANFFLAPSPTASGGTNNVVVQGGSVSTNTFVRLTYYNHYMSW
jgi:Phage tail protein